MSLKVIDVNKNTSESTASFPYLEVLQMHYTIIIVKTKFLRNLLLSNVEINKELIAFISSQIRLIKFVCVDVRNQFSIVFPAWIKDFRWYFFGQNYSDF